MHLSEVNSCSGEQEGAKRGHIGEIAFLEGETGDGNPTIQGCSYDSGCRWTGSDGGFLIRWMAGKPCRSMRTAGLDRANV